MVNKFRLQVGIPKPETAEEVNGAATVDGMRRAILRSRRDSSVIANVLHSAELNGLSGEDTYAMLAYHALLMLEEAWRRELDTAFLHPLPPLIVKDFR